jgi:hypothetical protein
MDYGEGSLEISELNFSGQVLLQWRFQEIFRTML